MANTGAAEVRKEQRRNKFWVRKKCRACLMFIVFALPITWGCLLGLQARFAFWLGWTVIAAVMALGITVGICEEIREGRKAAVATGLSPEESLWTIQGRRRLRRRAPFLVFFFGLLAVCFFCKLTGMLGWIDWGEILFFGCMVAECWQLIHHFADANEKKEVPPPSEEILVLASDSMTKLAAIRRYRKETRLGFKEAKKAIEAQLASATFVQ